MNIAAYQPFTLSDYPGKVAAIVFTQGCNFRCVYCHNACLIDMETPPAVDTEEFFSFLDRRKGKLGGVVITGGEPTLQPDLISFIERVKRMGFFVKLDTNGSRPKVLKELFERNLIDYIAMDIKAPIEKYDIVAGVEVYKADILESIRLIIDRGGIHYQFRTTVFESMLSPDDLGKCAQLVEGAHSYVLQEGIQH